MENKILIVDDASFLRRILNTYEASNGQEAVEKYKEIKPDLVLMDTKMPVMNGLEALKEIKSFDTDAMVIMLISMGEIEMQIEAIRYGAKDFINKPFKPDRVLRPIMDVLGC